MFGFLVLLMSSDGAQILVWELTGIGSVHKCFGGRLGRSGGGGSEKVSPKKEGSKMYGIFHLSINLRRRIKKIEQTKGGSHKN